MKKTAKKKVQKTFTTLEVVVLIVITVIVSLSIGCLLTYNLNKQSYVTLSNNKKKILKQYDYIVNNYYEKVDEKKLSDGAIKGMLESLGDDYSYLIDESSSDTFDIELEGKYKGIGIEIYQTEDSTLIIRTVFENSPANKAGLKVGDIILEVDGSNCSKQTPSEIAKYIREGTKQQFKLKIKRNNQIKEFTIKKDTVIIKSVISKTYKKNNKLIGYIYIGSFSNNAYNQFSKELSKLEKKNIDSLIIDVRDDSGGHLTTATRIISLFLNNKHIIYQTNTKGKIERFYSNGNKTKEYPIVVLQNNNSASASELLSAALKEELGAIIVGETSFGKGTVQELNNLSKDTEFKITTKEWLTPKGNSINKKGITPDYEVKLSDEYYNNPTDENDNQLQKALDVISKK